MAKWLMVLPPVFFAGLAAMYATARMADPMAPVTKIGLRPTLSDSLAQNGMIAMAMRLATMAIHSMKVDEKPLP